jgi:hypothetical protein
LGIGSRALRSILTSSTTIASLYHNLLATDEANPKLLADFGIH